MPNLFYLSGDSFQLLLFESSLFSIITAVVSGQHAVDLQGNAHRLGWIGASCYFALAYKGLQPDMAAT